MRKAIGKYIATNNHGDKIIVGVCNIVQMPKLVDTSPRIMIEICICLLIKPSTLNMCSQHQFSKLPEKGFFPNIPANQEDHW